QASQLRRFANQVLRLVHKPYQEVEHRNELGPLPVEIGITEHLPQIRLELEQPAVEHHRGQLAPGGALVPGDADQSYRFGSHAVLLARPRFFDITLIQSPLISSVSLY